jgi:hypothetical protein
MSRSTIAFQTNEEQREHIQDLARRQGCSVSEAMRRLVKQSIDTDATGWIEHDCTWAGQSFIVLAPSWIEARRQACLIAASIDTIHGALLSIVRRSEEPSTGILLECVDTGSIQGWMDVSWQTYSQDSEQRRNCRGGDLTWE